MRVDLDEHLSLADIAGMFELAPVSLWLEDASSVKVLFETWEAAGMTSLREWLQRPENMLECLGALKILKVNRKTLTLFEAADVTDFVTNIHKIVTTESLECLIDQWVQLWEGKTTFFGKTVNTTLTGRILDVQIRGNLLPGHERNWSRVLVTIEDVTELENARRAAAASETYALGLFQHSPVGLWVKDFSAVKCLLDEAREAGVVDLSRYFQSTPIFAERCVEAVQIIDINRQALCLFGAADKENFIKRLKSFGEQSYHDHLITEIVGLWEGKLFQQRDCISGTINGRDIYIHSQLSVLPGHEADWGKVQIAKLDISERKEAEARLRHIGSRDSVTQLYNRTFFAEKLAELEASTLDPVTVIMIDLNGLKRVNDSVGHGAGDEMLRRVGRILHGIVKQPFIAARIGGDEFVIVMPNADEDDGQSMIGNLERLLERDNETTPECDLSFSMGAATRCGSERLESVVTRADKAMYESKARFYAKRREPMTAPIDEAMLRH